MLHSRPLITGMLIVLAMSMASCVGLRRRASTLAHEILWLEPRLARDDELLGVPADVATADLDGDGYLDIVVSRGAPHAPGGNVNVLWGGPQVMPRPTAWVSGGPDETQLYSRIAIGDVDADGCLDIAVGRLHEPKKFERDFLGGVDVFFGQQAQSGTASCERRFGAYELVDDEPGIGVTDVRLADLDLDGLMDLAVARTNSLENYGIAVSSRIYWNQGASSPMFDTQLPTARWESEPMLASFSMLVDDIDANGNPDLLVTARGEIDEGQIKDMVVPIWGMLYLGQGTLWKSKSRVTPRLLTHRDMSHFSYREYAIPFDIARLGRSGEGVLIAVPYNSHRCRPGSWPFCLPSSGIEIFQLFEKRMVPVMTLDEDPKTWVHVTAVQRSGNLDLVTGRVDDRKQLRGGALCSYENVLVGSRPPVCWSVGHPVPWASAPYSEDADGDACREDLPVRRFKGTRRMVELLGSSPFVPRVEQSGIVLRPGEDFTHEIGTAFVTLRNPANYSSLKVTRPCVRPSLALVAGTKVPPSAEFSSGSIGLLVPKE